MSTTLTIADGPKMLREALCVAEHAVNRNVEPQNQHGAPRILAALIAECDRHRPLGPDGKHGDRHTDTCGCDDVPLDPSKVKAGDTVTLFVAPAGHAPTFTVAGETYLNGDIVMVGGWPVMDPRTTLTDHQPAPEPEPEWKPGTIGTAGTVRGLGYTGPVVRTDEHLLPWWTPSRVDGAHYHGEETVTDFVPDEPRPLPTRDDLARAMHDDYLPNGEPRLGRTHREILADAVLAHLRGESR